MNFKKYKSAIIVVAIVIIVLIVIYQLKNGGQTKSGFGTEKTYTLVSINYRADCANAIIQSSEDGVKSCFNQHDFNSTYKLTISKDKIVISADGKEEAVLNIDSVEKTKLAWGNIATQYNIGSIEIINKADPRLALLHTISHYKKLYMTSNRDFHMLSILDDKDKKTYHLYIVFSS